jgi:glycosyltransferase involved in cell wall biosynthesis
VIPTKNCAKTLKSSLSALYREIPVCHLIVIDANSNDGTIDILRGFPKVDLVSGPWHLGKAREIGIKRVDTDLFAFIDSDVIVGAKWMKEMLAYMHDPGVGAVAGTGRPTGTLMRLSERFARRMGLPPERPYTGNTLLRTSAVRDIRLPDVLLYEDNLIREHIEAKGLKWVRTDRSLAVQISTLFERDPKQAIYAGEYAWQFGFQRKMWLILLLLLFKIISSFAFAHLFSREKAFKAALHLTVVHIYYTSGLMKACLAK